MKFTLLLIILALLGCSKPAQSPSDPNAGDLSVSTNNLTIAGGKDAVDSFRITTKQKWSISASRTGVFSHSPFSGTGNATIVVRNLQDNPILLANEVVLTITAGTDLQYVYVNQPAKPATASVKHFLFGGDDMEEIIQSIYTSDSGFLHVGYTMSSDTVFPGRSGRKDIMVLRTDRSGNLIWKKAYGGFNDEIAWSVVRSGNDYYITGNTNSNNGLFSGSKGDEDLFLMKIDASGNLQFLKRFGGKGKDGGTKIILTADQQLIVVGKSSSRTGDITVADTSVNRMEDIWISGYSLAGDLTMSKVYGNAGNDIAFDVSESPDRSIFVTGHYSANPVGATAPNDFNISSGKEDAFVLKLSKAGDKIWFKPLGGSGSEQGMSLIALQDGSVIAAGFSESSDGTFRALSSGFDGWVVKLNSSGAETLVRMFGRSLDDVILNIQALGNGKYVACGQSKNSFVSSDYKADFDGWIFVFTDMGGTDWIETIVGDGNETYYSVLPNGSNGFLLSGATMSKNFPSNNKGSADAWITYFKR